VEGVTEAASESGGLYGSRALSPREELVAGLVNQGLTNQVIAEIINTQPPHLYFSSVLSCTGLADCHCGGETRLEPARGPGVSVHDGSIHPHNKDCGCSNCTKWESCTKGAVKKHLRAIYDKLGFSNQVELALWYEKRRYGRMSLSQQDAYRAMWLKIYERREQQKEAIRITIPVLTDDCPGRIGTILP
jgi:DNA-binding CsgD family transcriptional regulator